MFARLFAVVSLAALAVAIPAPLVIRDQCSGGEINCCNSVQQACDPRVSPLLGLLGVTDLTGLVGFNCSPISAIGLGSGAACQQQAVCCSNNQFNGLINVGCSPINLNA